MLDLTSIDWTFLFITLLAGFLLGFGTAVAFRHSRVQSARAIAEEIYRKNEALRREGHETLLSQLENAFARLSLDALEHSTDAFLKLADARFKEERTLSGSELGAKKALIDSQLNRMCGELDKVTELIRALERERHQAYGALDSRLISSQEQTKALLETTQALREALANNKTRGQWGERMAEDVLQLCGLRENINYYKQKQKAGGGSRPDFTFLLPQGRRLNMDVKFPLSNYLKSLETSSDVEKNLRQRDFLKDVRARIKEVTTRDYIDPEQHTLGYVLLFIPNEHMYALIHEQDPGLIEDAMKNSVILCSPLTLFAVLAVIRQAVDQFTLEKTTAEILMLMSTFRQQWGQFCERMNLLGRRITESQKEFESLMTTRRRCLDRALDRIDTLRAGHLEKSAASPEAEHSSDPEESA